MIGMTKEVKVKRNKILKIISIVLMTLSPILMVWDFIEESEFKLHYILVDIGLFLVGAYFFYLYRRKRRSEKSEG